MAGSAIVFPTTVRVTSVAHGFVAGNILRRAAGSWVLAQADSVANADVAGIVSYADANTFTLVTDGPITLAGLTDGAQYFLSPSSPGGYTATDPASVPVVGQVSVPVFWALSATQGFVRQLRGMEVSATTGTAVGRTGSAITFDVLAEYNTAASPSSGSVTADYTGAVAGTQVLCWFNHGAEPAWPADWTVAGPWDAGALNAVVLTYRTGTTVSGFIVSDAAGAPSNPENIYYLTGDWSIGSNGTPTQLTGFSGIPILAGKLYAVDMVLRGTCSGTGGLRLGFWANTGTDHLLRMAGRTDFTADAGVYFVPGSNGGYNSLQTSYAFFAATLANNFCRMSGTIRGGAVDGVFEMRGSSVTAAQTSTVYSDGSYVRVTRMN